MKNPAFWALYAIPVLVIALAFFLDMRAAATYEAFDVDVARAELGRVVGGAADLATPETLHEKAWQTFLGAQREARAIGLAGVLFTTVPLAATAIGRSQKNAVRELASAVPGTEDLRN
ncbi:hypothetical protein [Leucobacter aridicollis]|uniref:Uncharacterized protein n=1 Tax=Leucobacter aridicollis TaxID=283878 RepID=A0A852RH93_9MICO|nr:hypothetical protein [Leucobacter aridicollis]MBL3682627.1 hypothetical protein [Leucobacter aridicollis]NYD26052.1 hypothetical protein [Leucobacter aridicollis]